MSHEWSAGQITYRVVIEERGPRLWYRRARQEAWYPYSLTGHAAEALLDELGRLLVARAEESRS